jgi:hypothetical protein
MIDSISEKIIEDILSSDKSILSELLSVNPSDLSLVARQKTLRSGKLDLLYLCENELFLIELKVVGFYDDVIQQINGYYKDLKELQVQHKLIDSKIRKIILVTEAEPEDIEKCREESIQVLTYEPQFVLSKYYENFKELSYFLKIQSADYGVVRLGLLKSTLYHLSLGKSIVEICETEGKSEKTIRNRLSLAALLNLVVKFKQEYFLTDFGEQLLEIGDAKVEDRFNENQIELLSNFVKENPFYSSTTYTILAIVETVFILSKNTYPVPKDAVKDYFVKSVGKGQTWRKEKARETATYIFSNYACELQFLVKVANHFYISPKGIQAILLLQLNRSIKLIESQK